MYFSYYIITIIIIIIIFFFFLITYGNLTVDISGDAEVPVADCDQKHYDSQEKKTYKLKDYVDYWNGLRETSCGKKQCLYLKVRWLP